MASRPPKTAQPVCAGKPYRKIRVLAFVQQFDAELPKWLKAGHLPKERARGRAEQGYFFYLREGSQRGRYGVSGGAEIPLPFQLALVFESYFTR
ncbi:MAG: hypothetical protein WCD20_14490 [Rhodomicrobium sp.]